MPVKAGKRPPQKSLVGMDPDRIKAYVMLLVNEQLGRSECGQYVTSLKAISKKTARHFNLRVSGGLTNIIKEVLLETEHRHVRIKWFDERQTQLEIIRKPSRISRLLSKR